MQQIAHKGDTPADEHDKGNECRGAGDELHNARQRFQLGKEQLLKFSAENFPRLIEGGGDKQHAGQRARHHDRQKHEIAPLRTIDAALLCRRLLQAQGEQRLGVAAAHEQLKIKAAQSAARRVHKHPPCAERREIVGRLRRQRGDVPERDARLPSYEQPVFENEIFPVAGKGVAPPGEIGEQNDHQKNQNVKPGTAHPGIQRLGAADRQKTACRRQQQKEKVFADIGNDLQRVQAFFFNHDAPLP